MIFSVISSIISIIIIKFNFHHENEVSEFLYSFFQNVFAGLIVLIGTTLISYNRRRKEILEEILSYCFRFNKMFTKVEYLDMEDFKNFTQFDKELQEKDEKYDSYDEKTKRKMHRQYADELIQNDKLELEKMMKKYLFISEYDLTDFWNLYGELDFLFFNKKLKQEIYDNLFNYVGNVFDKVGIACYHFNKYFEYKNGNVLANRAFLKDLQKTIFVKIDQKEYEKYKNYPHVCFNGEETFVNDVYIKIRRQYDRIWTIAYGKKKDVNS